MSDDPSHRHGYDRESLMDWRKALPARAWAPALRCHLCEDEAALEYVNVDDGTYCIDCFEAL